MPPQIYDGSGRDLPLRFPLRAGALTMLFDDGALRYISNGNIELLRGVYFALRDDNWGTIPATMTLQEKLVHDDSFRIVFERTHERGDIRFKWTGTLIGSSDGTISMELDGTAETSFTSNRTGWCILHGHKAAGVPAVIEHVDGSETKDHFPDNILPQQPFFDIRAIRHEAAPGLWVRTEMVGDTFETEDQRNYSDASFKTYSTPQRLPKPLYINQEDRIQQTVTITADAAPASNVQTPFALLVNGTPISDTVFSTLNVTVDPSHNEPLPSIGLSLPADAEPLSDWQIERLRALKLSYVRAEIWLSQPDASSRLTRAAADAARIRAPLAIAAFLGDDAAHDVNALVKALDALHPQPVFAPISVFFSGDDATDPAKARLVKEKLARFSVPVGTGADYFVSLNGNRPHAAAVDFLTYGALPQEHAFDDLTLLETLWGQRQQVDSALVLSGGKPIHVGPITFKKRPGWQPAQETKTGALDPLPGQVDPRQMSLFGAAWTFGSIAAVASGCASMATYYDTVGMKGVIAADSADLPAPFGDLKGQVYPMWHVFKWIGDFASGEMIATTVNDSLAGTTLALRKDGKVRLLVANTTHQPLTVSLQSPYQSAVVKILDETTADPATQVPDAFQSAAGTPRQLSEDGTVTLELAPYAIACVDWNEG